MRISKIIITLAAIFSLQATAQVTGLSGWDIYLDPGHSRTENMGIYNYSEAEKNLRVSLHTLELLLTTTDIDTVWSSRYNDNVQVSLSQRTDEANSLGAAWYHSIHSNAGSATANNTLLLWGQYQNGLEKVPNGGKDMSRDMIPLLTAAMRIPTIGDYGDCSFYGCTFTGPYLHVNRTTFMPSELSEAGFHTSPTQNTRNMKAGRNGYGDGLAQPSSTSMGSIRNWQNSRFGTAGIRGRGQRPGIRYEFSGRIERLQHNEHKFRST